MGHTRWPFFYSRRDPAVTLRRIAFDGAPVLLVIHDTGGGYHFLDGEEWTMNDAAVAALEEMLALDPTLAETACLPPGYCAGRKSPEDPWEVGEFKDEETT